MPKTALYRQLFPRLFGLVVAVSWAGCAPPEPAPLPAFTDPLITCNADLVHGKSYTLVTQQLLLPTVTSSRGPTYVEDYDGDDKPENQLKNLLNVADIGNVDIHSALTRANQAGASLLLLQLTAPDLGTGQADCASLTIRHAAPPGPAGAAPKFDGTDIFQVAGTDITTFYGRIDNLVFQSIRSRDQATEVDFPLNLLWPLTASETVLMPLRGVGVSAHLQTDSQNQIVGLTEGAIHGVESAGALSALLIPAAARVLTAAINNAPSGDFRGSLIHWIEDQHGIASMRKCQVTADCCTRAPGTCKILPAEVLESAFGGVFTPDVEVFDSADNWHPVSGGKNRNGYSFGLGFAAVPAMF